MKPDSALRFEFLPSETDADRRNGWGRGILYVLGSPFWYANSDMQPESLNWTWVDLLEHIAAHWGSLVYEQSYPYPWLEGAVHPGEFWSVAERRWAMLGEEVAEEEEALLLSFERRHNLSFAWKGLSLPSLTLMRNGNVCWICPEGRAPIRAPFDECRATLVSIGDCLAQSFADSDNPRVKSAISKWRDRGVRAKDSFFELVTGMSHEELSVVQGGADAFDFWGVAANDSWEDGLVDEGPLLAAARMTAGTFDSATIRRVIDAVRAVRPGNIDALNNVSTKAFRQLQREPARFAFHGGYVAAEFVRESLGRDRAVRFDIDAVFRELDISVLTLSLGVKTIDAVAVWGSRGPCVLLNVDRQHKSPERTRMTLAHELAHLILDRTGGLPFCEVLGGAVDDFMERRASSFAAELLLPRRVVEWARTVSKESIGSFVTTLKHDYEVSKSVACAQIYNSRIFAQLDREERIFVEARLHRQDDIGAKHAIRIQPAGEVL